MKKLKLRRWVKVVLYILLLLLLSYVIVSLFHKKEVVITTGKNYTCHGSFIFKICVGENYEL